MLSFLKSFFLKKQAEQTKASLYTFLEIVPVYLNYFVPRSHDT